VTKPQCVVIAGPNGAGKTSSASRLLRDTVGVSAFVNADVIAQGLAGFSPEAQALEAGRIMLTRLGELVAAREDFAFETTLSGKSVERFLTKAVSSGYEVHVYYLWLPSPDVAVVRVRERVAAGGHNVPEKVIRRRYMRSLLNARRLVSSDVTMWRMYDASALESPRLIAHHAGDRPLVIDDGPCWDKVVRTLEEAK
jgi:predicted ABC-type ATPase